MLPRPVVCGQPILRNQFVYFDNNKSGKIIEVWEDFILIQVEKKNFRLNKESYHKLQPNVNYSWRLPGSINI